MAAVIIAFVVLSVIALLLEKPWIILVVFVVLAIIIGLILAFLFGTGLL